MCFGANFAWRCVVTIEFWPSASEANILGPHQFTKRIALPRLPSLPDLERGLQSYRFLSTCSNSFAIVRLTSSPGRAAYSHSSPRCLPTADMPAPNPGRFIVKRTNKEGGFKVVHRRWVVEQTFSWLHRNSRLMARYEALAIIAEGFAKLE